MRERNVLDSSSDDLETTVMPPLELFKKEMTVIEKERSKLKSRTKSGVYQKSGIPSKKSLKEIIVPKRSRCGRRKILGI